MDFLFPKKRSLSDRYLNIVLIIGIVTIIATLIYLISLKFNWYKTQTIVKKGEKETVKLGVERAAELLLFEAFSNSSNSTNKSKKNNKTSKILNKLRDNKKNKKDLVKKFAGIETNTKPKEFSRLESVNKNSNNKSNSFASIKEKMKDIKNDLFIEDENQSIKKKSSTEEIMDEVENLNYDVLDLNYLKSNLTNYWKSFDNKLMNSKSKNLDDSLKKWGFMKEKFLEIFQ